jgi:transcription initiation factor IIF auxiliary subunit
MILSLHCGLKTCKNFLEIKRTWKIQMTLRIRNRWHYRGMSEGYQWWDWEAFLDDSGSGELSNVNYVEYILHPTFPHPIRKITNPRGGFVLKTAGYGTFMFKAFVYTKDGGKKELTHILKLESEPEEGITD